MGNLVDRLRGAASAFSEALGTHTHDWYYTPKKDGTDPVFYHIPDVGIAIAILDSFYPSTLEQMAPLNIVHNSTLAGSSLAVAREFFVKYSPAVYQEIHQGEGSKYSFHGPKKEDLVIPKKISADELEQLCRTCRSAANILYHNHI